LATMFARKLLVDVLEPGEARPCPAAWLDSFAMRSFTGKSAFDEVLPAGEGRLEASFMVDLDALQREMEDWLTRKFGRGHPIKLRIVEQARD
jgi:hypothetical protein